MFAFRANNHRSLKRLIFAITGHALKHSPVNWQVLFIRHCLADIGINFRVVQIHELVINGTDCHPMGHAAAV